MSDALGTAYRPKPALGFRRAFWILWIVGLALLPGQWSIPVTDRDEARYSQAATQMMETGDYVDIRFQDQPRYVKPAGIYWMQVAATQPFGAAEAPIGAYRIPSFLGILLISLGTAMIGARIAGPAAGVIAGVLFGITLLAGAEGRIAKTDAMLVAAGTFAQLALFQILVQPRGAPPRLFRNWPLLFWVASGLAVLIKGPIFLIFTAGTIATYVACTRDWRALKRLRPLVGLPVFALVGLTWVALISIQTDGAFLKESVGHALLGKVTEGDDDHGGWPLYHLSFLAAMFWPSSLALGLGIWAGFRRRREPAMIFLLGWLIPGWVIYEFVGTKLPHYVFPAYPALALISAIGLVDAARGLSGGGRLAHLFGLALFGVGSLALAGGLVFGVQDLGGTWTAPWNLAALISLAAAGLAGLIFGLKPQIPRLGWCLVPTIAFLAVLTEGALPRLSGMWPSHSAWQVAGRLEGCNGSPLLAVAGYPEPSNVFYFGTETVLGDGEDAARHLLNNPSCGAALVDRREAERFLQVIGDAPVKSLASIKGTNVSKGRKLELTLIIHADSDLRLGDGPPRRL